MNPTLINLIKTYEKPKDFTYAHVTDDIITQAQKNLGCTLPLEYIHFLKTFG